MDLRQNIPSFGQEVLMIGSQDRTPDGYATAANKHPRLWLHSAYWWRLLNEYT